MCNSGHGESTGGENRPYLPTTFRDLRGEGGGSQRRPRRPRERGSRRSRLSRVPLLGPGRRRRADPSRLRLASESPGTCPATFPRPTASRKRSRPLLAKCRRLSRRKTTSEGGLASERISADSAPARGERACILRGQLDGDSSEANFASFALRIRHGNRQKVGRVRGRLRAGRDDSVPHQRTTTFDMIASARA